MRRLEVGDAVHQCQPPKTLVGFVLAAIFLAEAHTVTGAAVPRLLALVMVLLAALVLFERRHGTEPPHPALARSG